VASGKLIRHICFDEVAMSMPQEFELKLECDPNNAEDLKRLLACVQSGDSHTETINSVYFDTDDKKLGEAGVSLRVRADTLLKVAEKAHHEFSEVIDLNIAARCVRSAWQASRASHI